MPRKRDRKIVPPAMQEKRMDGVASSRRHETRLSKKLGKNAHRQRASGARQGKKGDIDWWGDGEDWWRSVKVENKTTVNKDKKSFSIKKAHLEKISKEAAVHDMLPMMAFEIPGMTTLTPRDWALVPIHSEDAMKKVLAGLSKNRRHEPPPPKVRHKKMPGSADFFNKTLYDFLKKRAVYGTRQREDGLLHVSEMYDFCPRREVFKISFKGGRKDPPDPGLQMIFDHGTMTHYWYQNAYMGPAGHLWGTWKCVACGDTREGVMPSKPCQCSIDECGSECTPDPEIGCRMCVAEGMLISTETGPEPIEDIIAGVKVWTHEGRLREVTGVWKEHSRRETVSITVYDCIYPVLLTKDHPVLIEVDGAFEDMDAGDVRVGDTAFFLNNGKPSRTEVVSVAEGPPQAVWNMEVAQDASFYAGEILVGNCTTWGRWEFVEPRVFFKKYGVIGSCDGVLMNLPGDKKKKRVWEIKTIHMEAFKRLSFPYTKHIAQASLYGIGLGVENLMMTYIPKGDMGEPPKAFRLETDEGLAYEALGKAEKFWNAIKRGLLPPRLCNARTAPKAIKCPHKKICFTNTAEADVKKILQEKKEEGELEWVKSSLELIQG